MVVRLVPVRAAEEQLRKILILFPTLNLLLIVGSQL